MNTRVIVGVLLVAIILIVGITLLHNGMYPSTPTVGGQQATTTVSANWQQYQDSANGVSFEYPSDLSVNKQDNNGYSDIQVTDPKSHAVYLSIMVVNDPSQPDTTSYFTGPYPKEIAPTGNDSTTTVVQKSINGLEGIEAYGYIAEGSEYSDVFMYKGSHLWEVHLDPVLEGHITSYPQAGTPIPDKSIYEQILASIKISS